MLVRDDACGDELADLLLEQRGFVKGGAVADETFGGSFGFLDQGDVVELSDFKAKKTALTGAEELSGAAQSEISLGESDARGFGF